jgi:hypothetical protein
VSPAGTVSVSGQTVTYTFATRIARNTAIVVAIGGINNPSVAVTQTAGNMTFYLQKVNDDALPPETHPTGTYSIVAPYLSVSVSPSNMAFDLYPDVAALPQAVTVNVSSSHPYVVTRDASPQGALFGLTVTGQAQGSRPAGTTALVDEFSADVPWTTEGDQDYTATVTYTVVQQ